MYYFYEIHFKDQTTCTKFCEIYDYLVNAYNTCGELFANNELSVKCETIFYSYDISSLLLLPLILSNSPERFVGEDKGASIARYEQMSNHSIRLAIHSTQDINRFMDTLEFEIEYIDSITYFECVTDREYSI